MPLVRRRFIKSRNVTNIIHISTHTHTLRTMPDLRLVFRIKQFRRYLSHEIWYHSKDWEHSTIRSLYFVLLLFYGMLHLWYSSVAVNLDWNFDTCFFAFLGLQVIWFLSTCFVFCKNQPISKKRQFSFNNYHEQALLFR